jgi:aminodeoxyfutalosine synthase
LTGFSLADLAHLESSSADTFSRLATAGLDAVADVPVDLLAHSAVASARAAGLRCQRLTVHAAAQDPLEILHAARQLQSALGGFRTFAPLPRTVSVTTPTTGYDDVKVVALARLLIRDIPSIQVDWPLYGPKLAQVALTVGADDVDGIAAVESAALGARRSALEEIRGNIRAAGLHAVERDGRFEARGR